MDKPYSTYVRKTTNEDVEYLAQHLRQEDIDECAAGGMTPLVALRRSVDTSFLNYSLYGPQSKCAAILGISHSPLGEDWGIVWLLGSEDIVRFKFLFLEHSRPMLDDLFIESNKSVFYNATYRENHVHHAWLRWLGFKFLREVKLPPYELPFFEFVKLRTF